jgi:hypothetical protein
MKLWWLLPLLLLFSPGATPLAVGQAPLELDGPVTTWSQADAPLESALLLDWYFDGDQSGDEVGYSVAAAGDVNGDGYEDVIVGAPHDTDTLYKEGVAYLFYGSPAGLSAVPQWTVGSGQKGALFGASVGTAGDVNDDGYDDVIVGAYGYKNAETQAGATFVFHGSDTGLKTTPDWTFVSGQGAADLGYSVGTAGDVNGDGYGDVVVGARWYDNGQENEGVVLAFYGSDTGLSTEPDWMAESNQISAGLGSSVSTAGDVNGDGYDDVIAGAPHADEDEGVTFIFFGSDTGLSADPDWTVPGDQAEAQFGSSVASAGNVNGDAYDDVVVGAPFYDSDQIDDGAVFAFYGSDAGPATAPDWTADGNQASMLFGMSVDTAGDVNGDGYDDVIVGAPLYYGGQADEGASFLFHGYATGLRLGASWWAEGNKAETWFGYAVDTAGDVNGDHYSDIVVGAPQYRIEREIRGRACGFYGPFYPPSPARIYLPLVVREAP